MFYYFVKDIGIDENVGVLCIFSELICISIFIGKFCIYFGEIIDNYIMINIVIFELDFFSGEVNVYNFYDGWGGIFLNFFIRKLLFVVYLWDW